MDVHKSEDEKPFKCDLCPKRYSQSYRLNSHKLENHCKAEEKQYHCDICTKKLLNFVPLFLNLNLIFFLFFSFITKGLLSTHIKQIHMRQSPMICDYCGKGFKCKNLLGKC